LYKSSFNLTLKRIPFLSLEEQVTKSISSLPYCHLPTTSALTSIFPDLIPETTYSFEISSNTFLDVS
jgi:hypothetical protein